MHPLARWFALHSTSSAEFLQRLIVRDVRTREGTVVTARWLRDVLAGSRKPLYEAAKVISEETGGEITVDQLRSYERPAPIAVAAPAPRRSVRRRKPSGSKQARPATRSRRAQSAAA